jgi:hypothetical protein
MRSSSCTPVTKLLLHEILRDINLALHSTDCSIQHRLLYTAQTAIHSTDCSTQHRLHYAAQTVLHSTDCTTQHRLLYTAQTALYSTDCSPQHRLLSTAQTALHSTDCSPQHSLLFTAQTALRSTDCSTQHRLAIWTSNHLHKFITVRRPTANKPAPKWWSLDQLQRVPVIQKDTMFCHKKLRSIYKQLRRIEFKFEFFIDVILPAKLWPCVWLSF